MVPKQLIDEDVAKALPPEWVAIIHEPANDLHCSAGGGTTLA